MSKLCKITAPCIEDAFKMGCNRYCHTYGVYSKYPKSQKIIDLSADAKSVRLDVYVEDGKGTVYNIEMQTTSNKNIPKRMRYYQGMIDLNILKKAKIIEV